MMEFLGMNGMYSDETYKKIFHSLGKPIYCYMIIDHLDKIEVRDEVDQLCKSILKFLLSKKGEYIISDIPAIRMNKYIPLSQNDDSEFIKEAVLCTTNYFIETVKKIILKSSDDLIYQLRQGGFLKEPLKNELGLLIKDIQTKIDKKLQFT